MCINLIKIPTEFISMALILPSEPIEKSKSNFNLVSDETVLFLDQGPKKRRWIF